MRPWTHTHTRRPDSVRQKSNNDFIVFLPRCGMRPKQCLVVGTGGWETWSEGAGGGVAVLRWPSSATLIVSREKAGVACAGRRPAGRGHRCHLPDHHCRKPEHIRSLSSSLPASERVATMTVTRIVPFAKLPLIWCRKHTFAAALLKLPFNLEWLILK